MVDREDIRDRIGGGGGDSSGGDSDGGGSTKSQSGSSKRSSNRSSGGSKPKKSKSEKLAEFKKGSGVDSASPSSKKGVPIGDAEDILRAIANVLLYAEGKYRAVEEPSNAREESSKVAADNIYEQYAELASQYEVQLIAEKYGIDWEEDIIIDVLKEQDYTGKVGV